MSTATIQQPATGGWAITGIQNSPNGDASTASPLLQPNEQFSISCKPTNPIIANDVFTIEIRPSAGAAFSISRTAPGGYNWSKCPLLIFSIILSGISNNHKIIGILSSKGFEQKGQPPDEAFWG